MHMANPQLTVRPLAAEEAEAAVELVFSAFLADLKPETRADELALFNSGRFQAVYDGATMVGAGGILNRELTVPGLRPVPVAAVTGVGVAVDQRRRGVLTALMRNQLHDLHDSGGESFAALWASEAGIYGRFGYGLASRRIRAVVRRPVRFLDGAGDGATEVHLAAVDKTGQALRKLHGEYTGSRIGGLSRPEEYWPYLLADHEAHREGASALRFAVHPEGYAQFRVRENWTSDGPRHKVSVWDLVSVTPDAHAALWRFLANLDLAGEISYGNAPADEPLPFLLADPRAASTELTDALFVRLVDVDRALAIRRYAAAVDVVFEVSDEFCPWNAGRWRLATDESGAAEVTRTSAAPDLACSATELGAAYLGGTRLHVLAAAGRVVEVRSGALRAASGAFAGENEPHTLEVF